MPAFNLQASLTDTSVNGELLLTEDDESAIMGFHIPGLTVGQFSLDPDTGYLYNDLEIIAASLNYGTPLQVNTIPCSDIGLYGYQPLLCSLALDGTLACTVQDSPTYAVLQLNSDREPPYFVLFIGETLADDNESVTLTRVDSTIGSTACVAVCPAPSSTPF